MNSFFEWLSVSLESHAALAVFASIAWGFASVALSPCHLASVPLAVSFLRKDGKSGALGTSFSVAVGILGSLVVIGAVTIAAGRIAGDLWGFGPWIAVVVLLLAGLYLMGVLQVPTHFRIQQDRIPRNKRGGLLVGLLLGVTLGPCTFAFFAPVFAAAFGTAARGMGMSMALVAGFAFGHVVTVTAAGLVGLQVGGWLRRAGTTTKWLRTAMGVLLLFSGLYLIVTIP